MSAQVTDNLPLLAGAPNGIKKLRELILELAVRGKLVPQDPNDEPASELLKRIAEEKARQVAEGRLKKQKPQAAIEVETFGTKLPQTWEWVPLLEITTGMDSGWSPACLSNSSPSDDVWGVLKTTAVQVMKYLEHENKELPDNLEPRPEAETKVGDILFTRAGPMNRVGISCLVQSTRPKLMISDKIIRFHPIEIGANGRFVALCLNAGVTAKYLEEAKSGMAASQVNISQEKLKVAPIPLPPLVEQHRIVAKVDELMALCARLEAKQADAESAHAQLVQALLDSLTQAADADDFAQSWQRLAEHFHTLFTTESSIDALKQTLLQLAVMGKLVPQDPNDEPASELLKRIAEEKARLIEAGKLKKKKSAPHSNDEGLPFELPSGWSLARWEGVTEWITYGFTRPMSHVEFGPKIITAKNVKYGFVEFEDVHFASEEEFSCLNDKDKPKTGDILVTKDGSIGRAAVVDTDEAFCINQSVAVLWLRHGLLNPNFLVNLIHSPFLQKIIWDAAAGAAIKHISITEFLTFPLPLPPVNEQHRIVAKVDQLMALCDQLKQRLSQARTLYEQLANTLVEQAVA